MTTYWTLVKEVIHRADILLEVLDARLPDETRNPELEGKIKEIGKKIIFVMNKSDLVSQDIMEKEKKRLQKISPTVFVSSKLHQGTKMLREEILKNVSKDQIKVGVLGYPNVGKSSIINVLKGKKSAPTSSFSGYTKGLMDVRITSRIMLVDTPGVIPYMERNEFKHALIGTKNVQQIYMTFLNNILFEVFINIILNLSNMPLIPRINSVSSSIPSFLFTIDTGMLIASSSRL